MTVSIRSGAPSDAPRLEGIERLSFADPSWNAADFFRYDCIVAEIDGQVAGFLVSRSVHLEREILNLAVAPEWRRRGIAKTLLEHHLAQGGTHFLEVRESNLAAQALYRTLGFREVGRRLGYYDRPAESAIVMRMK
ncbi:MAG TPA: ribosomal protein S18-alanine N-acetyltransferase [Bryobacteraceae bacterium]|nr:ribosomal protein S18-alanine N-acetyltransferase [Bryobacteraceae bacterium]